MKRLPVYCVTAFILLSVVGCTRSPHRLQLFFPSGPSLLSAEEKGRFVLIYNDVTCEMERDDGLSPYDIGVAAPQLFLVGEYPAEAVNASGRTRKQGG